VETLRTWHSGLNKLPLRPCVGVSAETLEEWRALKAEVGIGCTVIDRALEDAGNATATPRLQKGNRFYNICNTYVYGGGNGVAGRLPWSGLASHTLLCRCERRGRARRDEPVHTAPVRRAWWSDLL
jgi:hypothetical protein